MKTWTATDARDRLYEVIGSALAGEPQRVTRRGRDAVIFVSETEWQRMGEGQPEAEDATSTPPIRSNVIDGE